MRKKIVISWSIEFGPIMAFFIALSFLGETDNGFIQSTAIFTVLTCFSLLASYVIEKRIAWFPFIAGVSVIIFGVMTLITKSPSIFVFKDTVYNGAFGIFLLLGTFFNRGLLKPLFSTLFDMSDRGWFVLSLRWGIFFVSLAFLNEMVWGIYGLDAWVMYKFWSTIATVVFGFYQIKLSKKHRNEGASPWGMRVVPINRD